jgi:hypothetical protein
MATPESRASQEVKLRASSQWQCKLFRNNSGMLYNQDGVPVRYGLGNISRKFNSQVKSSDEIGWTPVLITTDMVGKTMAVFTAFENKTMKFKIRDSYRDGSREAAQLKFINIVKQAHGIAGFTRCSDDVDTAIGEFIKCMTSKE